MKEVFKSERAGLTPLPYSITLKWVKIGQNLLGTEPKWPHKMLDTRRGDVEGVDVFSGAAVGDVVCYFYPHTIPAPSTPVQ